MGLDRWGSDPSMKAIPNSNEAVCSWLSHAQSSGSDPYQYLFDARNVYKLDRCDSNLVAAERCCRRPKHQQKHQRGQVLSFAPSSCKLPLQSNSAEFLNMARPLRIEFPGAVYHVTSRGDRREPIVLGDEDREDLLGVLGQALHRFDACALAWCVMDNHYHFVLHTRQPNLSLLMRHVNGVYAQKALGSSLALCPQQC